VTRPRLVGINHVALEVRDLERALAFYRQVFRVRQVDQEPGMAFIDIGDQFIALARTESTSVDAERHFGLVVDDKALAREALAAAGAEVLPGRRLDFRDPDGNRVQVVQYDQIQFSKTDVILRSLGLAPGKTEQARAELARKNLL
jgi:catechol 2,3-dioxygenase-like lactoylglutathione lyase family enzyme